MSKFIAAMDHSGGSTGGVLDRYGAIWNESNKMETVHGMRMRMVNSPSFNQDNIFGAILYKDSVTRGLSKVLNDMNIETFLKIDSGLNEDGTMKQFPLKQMIEFANQPAVEAFGTKMRSVVKDISMVKPVLDQQFTIAQTICEAGLMPIIEPEVPIEHPQKEAIEDELKLQLYEKLDDFKGVCMLKLTPPEQPNQYYDFTQHNKVSWVVFLSGGYSTSEACNRLSLNDNVSASFSRALSEGLHANQTPDRFNEVMNNNIKMISEAVS